MRAICEGCSGIETAIPAVHDDERFGARNLTGAADRVHDALQMVDVIYSQPDQDIRVAGQCVKLLCLDNPPHNVGDLSRFCGAAEAHFDECLEGAAAMLVNDGSVPAYDANPLEPINASLHRSRRQVDLARDVADGEPPPAAQNVENFAIDAIYHAIHELKVSCKR